MIPWPSMSESPTSKLHALWSVSFLLALNLPVSSLCSSYAHRAMRRRKKGPFRRPSYFGTSLSIVRWLFPRPQLFHMVMNLLGQMWFFFFLIQTWSKWERIFASIENDTKPNPLEYYFHFNSYFIINIIIYLKKFLIPIVRATVFKGAI